jgi:hypothetical protein
MCRKSILAIFLVAFVGLAWAQNPANIQVAHPGVAETQSDPCTPPPPSDISGEFKEAVTREWSGPKGALHMLEALKHYIDNGAANVNAALKELVLGAPCNEDLYRAALGVPDTTGQPAGQGLPDVLQTIATANRRDVSEFQRDALFQQVSGLLDRIKGSPTGKQAMVETNSFFSRQDNFRALYRLLYFLSEDKTHSDSLLTDLETLRTAFEKDKGRLAETVAKKISGKK